MSRKLKGVDLLSDQQTASKTDKKIVFFLSVMFKIWITLFFIVENALLLYICSVHRLRISSCRANEQKYFRPQTSDDLLVFASCTRHPLRNAVIVLLSAKAGLRAGEIANLTWDMLVDATGALSGLIELADSAAKKGSGRSIPIHPDLAAALAAWRQVATAMLTMSSRRSAAARMTALSIVVWFNRAFKNIGLKGCSSHSGRRTFVTRAARVVHKAGGSLARRSTAGRPSVDPDHAAVHRRRQRRAAQTGRDDLRAMAATVTIRHRQTTGQNHPKIAKPNSGSTRPRCSAHSCNLRPRRFADLDRRHSSRPCS